MTFGIAARLIGLFLLVSASAFPAWAQSEGTGADANVSVAEMADATLDKVAETLNTLSSDFGENQDNESELATYRARLASETGSITDVSAQLQDRLAVIEERLASLGEPTADSAAPEDSIITRERHSLETERAALNGVLGRADDLSSRASRLGNEIASARRDVFTNTLFERTVIDQAAFDNAKGAFSEQWSVFARSVTSWISFTWNYRRMQLLGALFLSSLTALAFVSVGYRVFSPFLTRSSDIGDPSYISRLSVAFWSTVLPSATTAAFATSIYIFLDSFDVLRSVIAPMVAAALRVSVILFFVIKITRAVLAPAKPNWRLVNVSDHGAWSLTLSVLALVLVNGLDYLAGEIYTALGSPLVLTVANSLIASVLAGLVILFIAFIRAVPVAEGELEGRGAPWPPVLRVSFAAIGILLIVTALLGYIGLARFASTQIVLTGAILVTMWIGFVSGRAVSQRNALSDTYVGRLLKERLQLGDVALDQAGLAAGLGIYFIVLALGIPLILLQWGYYAQDIWIWVRAITTNIEIGSIQISLVSIAVGIVLFFIGLYLSRWLLRWLDGNVLARSNLDSGVRNSVRTGLGYVGAGIALLVGVSAAGINLSSLALVAGALSLGIGFGLQNIVSNFVSGLILLVERPFKVGDWIVTGSTEGIVKHISVRATEIETFQHQSIIVPNSDLINASLANWTHRNKLGRTEVAIGVSYDADPQRVFDLLLEIGNEHPKALKNPEPSVEFVGFGDSSIDFSLRIYLANVLDAFDARNDLRLAIAARLKAEGIEIPFPQRDINIRVQELEKLQAAAPAKKPTRKRPTKPVRDDMGGLGDDVEDGDGEGGGGGDR